MEDENEKHQYGSRFRVSGDGHGVLLATSSSRVGFSIPGWQPLYFGDQKGIPLFLPFQRFRK
eukprot:scaffold442_cov110-Cylindrotheca_fusiformis.AAC.9